MTTQEFVKKEAGQYVGVNAQSYNYRHGFTDGLTKGLEIAEGLAEWIREIAETGFDGTWHLYSIDRVYKSLTSAELISIYLTEKYGK